MTRSAVAAMTTAMVVLALADSAGAAPSRAHEGPQPAARIVPVRAVVSGGVERLPLVGGRVVLRHHGRTVGTGRTGRDGLALIRLARVPRSLRATVSGATVDGRRLHTALSATVRRYRAPAELCVTPVTTLVAQTGRPDRVRSLLHLSRNDDMRCDDARSDAWFDGRAFLATAARHGGVAAYLAQLRRQTRHPRAHSAQASGDWASTASTAADGVNAGLEGLLKTGAFSSLGWLKAASGWAGVAFGTFDVLDAFFGGSSGPTNADVISDLNQDFTALDDAVAELQDSVAVVQQSVTQVEATTLGSAQAQIVADAATMASDIYTAASYLNSLASAANQITCGTATQCPADQPTVAQVCPASTLLTWNDETGQVVYPAGWTGDGTTPLQDACINYSELVYSEGGFISQMDGLNWASLGTLASWVNGSGSVPGIVQYTSMGTMVQVRFLDNQSSLVTQAMFDSYLALYQQLMTELMVYASATGEPAIDQQTGLTAQPTVGQFEAAAPTTVPPGTVVDATTGLVWSQMIGANVPCAYLLGAGAGGACQSQSSVPMANGGAGFDNAPATLTPQSISGPGLPTIGSVTGGAPTLNVDPNAVTPIDPTSITSPTSTGTPLTDWYGAQPAQTSTLFASATPSAGQTGGDWLQQAAGQNGGAGFSPSIFGSGVSIPVSGVTFQKTGTNGVCFTGSCYTLQLASPAASCTLAGNTGCASPGLNATTLDNASDLNNGGLNGGQGALAAAVGASNWVSAVSGCTDVDILTGTCRSGDTATYASAFGAQDVTGWVTWFVRNPPPTAAGATTECYFYAPPDYNPTPGLYATPNTTQGSAACPSPAYPGNNGLLSQTLTPGAGS